MRNLSGGLAASTLFGAGREFDNYVLDEAHMLRILNKFHIGAKELRRRAMYTVAMSATPVMTSPLVRLHHQ